MEIIAYEMRFQKDIIEQSNISCVSFEEKYFSTYMHIYNECFYEMRKTLNIEPYNFLNNYKGIHHNTHNIRRHNQSCHTPHNLAYWVIQDSCCNLEYSYKTPFFITDIVYFCIPVLWKKAFRSILYFSRFFVWHCGDWIF